MGRRPVTPQKAQGQVMEPQVSEPMAKGTSPAATAAAEPEEEPPAQRAVSQGVRHGPVLDASPVW